MGVEVLIVLALILVNGLFSGSEIAVISVRKAHVVERAAAGDRRARAVQRLRDDPERFLATVQVGMTAVNVAAAAFGGSRIASDLAPTLQRAGFGRYAEDVAFAIVIVALTFLTTVLGELVPKSLALRYSNRYAFWAGRPFLRLSRLAAPVVWFLTASSNLVLRLFGDKTSFSEARVSREEVKQVVEAAASAGSVDPKASEIASRALELPEVKVSDLMVPRDRIVALPRNASTEEIQRTLVDEAHSRVPVYERDVDQITGYVHARDVLAHVWQRGTVSMDEIVRPILAVAGTQRIHNVLREMQARHVSLAVVVDERGLTSGVVSIEDIVEELVGDIEDETDAPEDTIRNESVDRALVPGWVPVRKVNRELHTALPTTQGATLAGLCMSLALAIPSVGTRLKAEDGTELEIVDASPRRIRMVRVHHHHDAPEAPSADEMSR